jgi:hypothetical protein
VPIDAAGGALDRIDARQERTFKVEQTHRETRTLAIGATGALDLETHSGDITVTAGGGRDATIEIIRRARGRTDADAKLGLEQVKVTVDQRPDRARVRAVYPDRQGNVYSVDVSYVITAPAGTHVTAETISGHVTIKGIRGDVTVDVTSGHVDLSGSRVSQAKTISGPVTLTDVETPDAFPIVRRLDRISERTRGAPALDIAVVTANAPILDAVESAGLEAREQRAIGQEAPSPDMRTIVDDDIRAIGSIPRADIA